jgi:phospholipid/cholesterol/gamma-HCH transport system substrate-binding protein
MSDADKTQSHLEAKAIVLLALLLALVCASALYVMYARGVFEESQELILLADDSEGVIVGMDLTFSGFPIGRVRKIELAPDGKVRIVIDVAHKDAGWLRTSSVFTMERGVVGDTRLRAFTGILTDPPLPAGASRTVLRGDATAELPALLSSVRTLAENLERMTRQDSSLSQSLDNVKTLTEKFKGRYGVLGAALGGEDNARKVVEALDRANGLLARADKLLVNADARLFGKEGVATASQEAIAQLQVLLQEARASLKKVDGVLTDAQAISANVRVASTDLAALRSEVEASLRKVEHLVDEVNRLWPLKRDTEIKLP